MTLVKKMMFSAEMLSFLLVSKDKSVCFLQRYLGTR